MASPVHDLRSQQPASGTVDEEDADLPAVAHTERYTADRLQLVLHPINDLGEEESHLRRDRASWVCLLD
jgi:hypothetical protein